MTTPFDGRLLWWHWQGGRVTEPTIEELATAVRAATPTVAGIAIKTSTGAQWQGDYDDPKREMAITGPDSIARWVEVLARHDLETHLWCVLRGEDPAREAALVVQACQVPGVRSMILDVEAGPCYFGGQPPEVAHALITQVRQGLPPTFHLGLCLFADNGEADAIHLDVWLPCVQSLHPMVYHWEHSRATSRPEPYLDRAFGALSPYGLPIVPLLQTYPDPTTGADPPGEHIYAATVHALRRGAPGVGYFRWGAASPAAFEAIRRVSLRQLR